MTSFHLIASTFFSECVACLVNYGLNPYFCEYAYWGSVCYFTLTLLAEYEPPNPLAFVLAN